MAEKQEKREARRAAAKYFFLSLTVSLPVLGGVLALSLRLLGPAVSSSHDPGDASADPFYLPEEKDNLALILIGGEDPKAPPQFYTLIFLNAAKGRIPVASFPPQTVVDREGARYTLTELWGREGAKGAGSALMEYLHVRDYRWVFFRRDALIAAMDRLGPMEFQLPYTLNFSSGAGQVSFSQGRQLVDGVKFYDLMSCPVYPGGEEGRCNMSSRLFAAYLNQRLDSVLSNQADLVFETIINSVETDFSVMDYQERRGALVFLAKLGGSPASDIAVDGVFNESGDSFGLPPSTLQSLRGVFGEEE
ncbi:MAG: hypothetical protein PHD67_10230 [Oscillospiraceae bacterium]|nr:hypothetical protein [Oscillospiraceae bacterium]